MSEPRLPTSNLMSQLWEFATHGDSRQERLHGPTLCRQAAQEIECLQSEIGELQFHVNGLKTENAAFAERESRLMAGRENSQRVNDNGAREIERLRAALASIGEYDCPGGVHPKHCLGCAACDATKALSADPLTVETREKRETGWLVESGATAPNTEYRTMDQMGVHWTKDINKAIRFARRADAEMFAAGDEDAWCIVEHQWITPSPVETTPSPGANLCHWAGCHEPKSPDEPYLCAKHAEQRDSGTLPKPDYDASEAGAPKASAPVLEPGPDLACEGFIPDPHSRFCDRCGYPQHEHKRAQNGKANDAI